MSTDTSPHTVQEATDTVNFLGLDVVVPPYHDWRLGQPIYCQVGMEKSGWNVGGEGMTRHHIWRLSVAHRQDNGPGQRSTFTYHPDHHGRVFPSECTMRQYMLDHGLVHPYDRERAR